MKRFLLMATLGVVPLGCVSNQGDASIRFLNAFSLDESCTPDVSRFISQGALDVSGGGNYVLAMNVETTTTSRSVDVQGNVVSSGSGLGDFTATEVLYEYEVYGGSVDLGLPKEEATAIYAVYRPSTLGGGNSYLFVNAFGPEAITALSENVSVGDDPVTVIPKIKVKGHFSSSSLLSSQSNEFTFPIRVFSTGYSGSCPAGQSAKGTCYLGQGGPVCR